MATWNELFLDEKNIAVLPQPEIYKFTKKVEGIFPGEKLKLWDFCCGAGRHTILLSSLGYDTYGSDVSENGIKITKRKLQENNLQAHLKISDMTERPFQKIKFHGVFSWDAIHHNTIGNIKKSVDITHDCLEEKGLLLVHLLSTKSGSHNKGIEIEKNTFINDDGDEAGVPHHYFDEKDVRELLKGWKFLCLSEQVNTYIETEQEFYRTNPFPYTKWNVIVQRIH